ncbi:MAG: hypothetical protein ACMUIL_13880 [bacterium]
MKKFCLLLLLLTVTLLHPDLAPGIDDCRITGKISLGYDDHVSEQSDSTAGRSFTHVYLDSRFSLPRFKRLEGAFRLQNGLKIVREEENIALNQVDLRFSLSLSPRISSELLQELKQKTVPVSSASPVHYEYGYLYWHSGLAFKYNGGFFRGSIRYLVRHQDYQDEDFFDSDNQQTQFMINAVLSPKLTGCLTGKAERIRFSKERAFDPEWKEERIDTLYGLSIGFEWLDIMLINPTYSLHKNRSQQSEYDYYAHYWSILAAIPLWRETTLQCYGHLQRRDYESAPPPPSEPLDEENTEQLHKLLVLSLSKEVRTRCSLEVRYALSQSDPSISSFGYKKQSYSLGVSYTF